MRIQERGPRYGRSGGPSGRARATREGFERLWSGSSSSKSWHHRDLGYTVPPPVFVRATARLCSVIGDFGRPRRCATKRNAPLQDARQTESANDDLSPPLTSTICSARHSAFRVSASGRARSATGLLGEARTRAGPPNGRFQALLAHVRSRRLRASLETRSTGRHPHGTITVAYIDAGRPSRVLAEDWQIVVGYPRPLQLRSWLYLVPPRTNVADVITAPTVIAIRPATTATGKPRVACRTCSFLRSPLSRFSCRSVPSRGLSQSGGRR